MYEFHELNQNNIDEINHPGSGGFFYVFIQDGDLRLYHTDGFMDNVRF